MKLPYRCIPRVEVLENRSLLSADLAGGILSVSGTAGADRIEVGVAADAGLWVSVNDEMHYFHPAEVQELHILAGEGKNWVSIDDDVLVDAWITGGRKKDYLDGGGGSDYIDGQRGKDSLFGGAGDDILHGGSSRDYLDGGDGLDLLDSDGGSDIEVDGLAVDLDVEFEALLAGPTGALGHAEFELEQEGDELEVEFEIGIAGAAPNTVHDVTVDGVLVGQIMTDASGHGALHLSNDPDGSAEGVLLETFPPITAGSVVVVSSGGTNIVEGTFAIDAGESDGDSDASADSDGASDAASDGWADAWTDGGSDGAPDPLQ